MRTIILAAMAAMFLVPAAHAAGEHDTAIRKLVDNTIKGWVSDPAIIQAIRSQNASNAALSQSDIEALDQKWRAETAASVKPLISEVLARPASQKLLRHKNEGEGLFTEIFVMDNKGLNVAQSDVTSDYWQGDEAKWKKSYLAGPGSVFIDDVEFDESAQAFQSQVSVAITDPDTGAAIGAITVGVNVELLSN